MSVLNRMFLAFCISFEPRFFILINKVLIECRRVPLTIIDGLKFNCFTEPYETLKYTSCFSQLS